MSDVPVSTAIAAVLVSLSSGAAVGYVAGFVDGWTGKKFLGILRRLLRRKANA